MRLDFFKSFLQATGVKFNKLAEKLGLSSNAVWLWFSPKIDDVKLSYVKKTAELAGYDCFVTITKRNDILNEHDPRSMASYRYVNGSLIENNLSFLNMFMQRYAISKKDLSEKIHVPYTTLLYMFKEGDAFISRLYEIAEAYDAIVHFIFEKKFSEEIQKQLLLEDGPKIISQIISENVF